MKLFLLLLFPDTIFLISIFDLLKYSLKMKIILIKNIEYKKSTLGFLYKLNIIKIMAFYTINKSILIGKCIKVENMDFKHYGYNKIEKNGFL